MRLVALKRVRYPRGPNAREYKPGEEFDTLSDRDAKALTLVGVAKSAPVAPAPLDMPKPEPTFGLYGTAAVSPDESETHDRPRRGRSRRYARRDLTPEDE